MNTPDVFSVANGCVTHVNGVPEIKPRSLANVALNLLVQHCGVPAMISLFAAAAADNSAHDIPESVIKRSVWQIPSRHALRSDLENMATLAAGIRQFGTHEQQDALHYWSHMYSGFDIAVRTATETGAATLLLESSRRVATAWLFPSPFGYGVAPLRLLEHWGRDAAAVPVLHDALKEMKARDPSYGPIRGQLAEFETALQESRP
jgi:hypothetical protein